MAKKFRGYIFSARLIFQVFGKHDDRKTPDSGVMETDRAIAPPHFSMSGNFLPKIQNL